MHIHQQRAERVNLERLIDSLLPGEVEAIDEKTTVRSLWRSACHDHANTTIAHMVEPRLITSGWAGWLRHGDAGRRQIFLFLMPGDFIVPGLFDLECCDLVSLTPLRTVNAAPLVAFAATQTPHTSAMIANSGKYYRLLLLDHLTRLTAGCTTRSLAHLLVEFHIRSSRSGANVGGKFSLPIGQRVLASALGRSTVQVNKIIHQFQDQGLLTVGYDWLEVHEPEKLRTMSGMTHSLLGPSRPTASLGAHR
jgi:CRP-like cAMP-binding protein